MTSTSKGSQVGGYRNEVDPQKLGPALVITAGLILGMRTIRWEATHSDGLAGEEWEKEVEHSARVAKRMLSFLTTRYPDLFQSKQVPWYVATDEDCPNKEKGVPFIEVMRCNVIGLAAGNALGKVSLRLSACDSLRGGPTEESGVI